MKKFTKFVAGVMALTMAAGLAVMAAGSSTTTNTTVSATQAAAPAVDYIVYRDSTSTVTRAAAVKTAGTVIRVASDYADVTDNKAIATAIAPDKATSDALKAYVAAAAPGATLVGPVKVQLYNAGKAISTGFGTFRAIIGVGAKYNGQAVTAYVYHQDGTVEAIALTVANGRVIVPLTVTGTIILAF